MLACIIIQVVSCIVSYFFIVSRLEKHLKKPWSLITRCFYFSSKWFAKSSCINPTPFKFRENVAQIFWKNVFQKSQESIFHGTRNCKMV